MDLALPVFVHVIYSCSGVLYSVLVCIVFNGLMIYDSYIACRNCVQCKLSETFLKDIFVDEACN